MFLVGKACKMVLQSPAPVKLLPTSESIHHTESYDLEYIASPEWETCIN